MTEAEETLRLALERRQREGSLRQLRSFPPHCVDFYSNDYLSYARTCRQSDIYPVEFDHSGSCTMANTPFMTRPRGLEATSLEPVWLGATGSRLLSGNSSSVQRLETYLADAFNAQAALVFNSGYDLNLGLLQALGSETDAIVMDEAMHASAKDGMRLSKAAGFFFRHNDLDHLEHRLARLRATLDRKKPRDQLRATQKPRAIFVVIESVYSMDGDLAPLMEIVALCKRFDAALIVDEAHGVGTIGKHGEGLVAELGLERDVFARVNTFGKALGAHGAVLLGSETLRDYAVNFCHSFMYSTALPPHSLEAMGNAVARLKRDPTSVRLLHDRIALLNRKLGLSKHPSPVYSLVFANSPAELTECSEQLLKRNMVVLPIRSPTVKRGTERLRICLHTHNTEQEISELHEELNKYAGIWQKHLPHGNWN